MKEKQFKYIMKRKEFVCGIVFLPVYIAFLPIFITLISTHFIPEISDERLTLIFYLVSFLAILLVFHRYLHASFSDFIDARFTSFYSIISGYIVYYIFMYAVSILLYLFNAPTNPNDEAILSQIARNPGMIIASAVLLGPIVEETLFRGVIFGFLRKKSRLLAYMLCFTLFSLYHLWEYFFIGFTSNIFLNLLECLPATFALCWSYERSNSIWSAIFLHMLINSLSVLAFI